MFNLTNNVRPLNIITPACRLLFALLIVCLISSEECFAQVKISGRVTDTQSKPIPYVNIGIFKKGIGTISNEDGSFSLHVPVQYQGDSIMFSAIGYETVVLPAGNLSQIILREKTVLLKEVTVTAKSAKPKSVEFGNRYWEGPNGVQFLDTLYAGAAMAILINPDFTPAYVIKSRIRIQLNTLGEFKIRLRLLSVNTVTGLPDEDLLNESVVITSKTDNRWIETDLSEYHLKPEQPFFLVYEWIMDDKARRILARDFDVYAKQHPEDFVEVKRVVDGKEVSSIENNFHRGVLFGVSRNPWSIKTYSCYYRRSSLAEWNKSMYILAARITLSDVPPAE
ncbi:carboxypeptidase-like regulatory domain-containing protein [Chryseolinea sp. T2]|uniref:carboxypeptidase-like regulatory domain-containing protein n=1 Tax=Chryseolinea sp. T2 TaxID=3129255 RepID=UPI00307802D9